MVGKPLKCPGCGARFAPAHFNQRYCADRCRRASYQRAYAARFRRAFGVHFTTHYWRKRHPGRPVRVWDGPGT